MQSATDMGIMGLSLFLLLQSMSLVSVNGILEQGDVQRQKLNGTGDETRRVGLDYDDAKRSQPWIRPWQHFFNGRDYSLAQLQIDKTNNMEGQGLQDFMLEVNLLFFNQSETTSTTCDGKGKRTRLGIKLYVQISGRNVSDEMEPRFRHVDKDCEMIYRKANRKIKDETYHHMRPRKRRSAFNPHYDDDDSNILISQGLIIDSPPRILRQQPRDIFELPPTLPEQLVREQIRGPFTAPAGMTDESIMGLLRLITSLSARRTRGPLRLPPGITDRNVRELLRFMTGISMERTSAPLLLPPVITGRSISGLIQLLTGITLNTSGGPIGLLRGILVEIARGLFQMITGIPPASSPSPPELPESSPEVSAPLSGLSVSPFESERLVMGRSGVTEESVRELLRMITDTSMGRTAAPLRLPPGITGRSLSGLFTLLTGIQVDTTRGPLGFLQSILQGIARGLIQMIPGVSPGSTTSQTGSSSSQTGSSASQARLQPIFIEGIANGPFLFNSDTPIRRDGGFARGPVPLTPVILEERVRGPLLFSSRSQALPPSLIQEEIDMNPFFLPPAIQTRRAKGLYQLPPGTSAIDISGRAIGFPPGVRANILPPSERAIRFPPGVRANILPPSGRAIGFPPGARANILPPSERAIRFPISGRARGLPPGLRANTLPSSEHAIPSSRKAKYLRRRTIGLPPSRRIIRLSIAKDVSDGPIGPLIDPPIGPPIDLEPHAIPIGANIKFMRSKRSIRPYSNDKPPYHSSSSHTLQNNKAAQKKENSVKVSNKATNPTLYHGSIENARKNDNSHVKENKLQDGGVSLLNTVLACAIREYYGNITVIEPKVTFAPGELFLPPAQMEHVAYHEISASKSCLVNTQWIVLKKPIKLL